VGVAWRPLRAVRPGLLPADGRKGVMGGQLNKIVGLISLACYCAACGL
jgi:hypothetical protein